MELSFLEINALHKLLNKVKFDERLEPSELNHFAASSYISSALRKVRTAYLNSPEIKSYSNTEADDQLPFQIRNTHSVDGISQRLTSLQIKEKEWIRSRTMLEKNEYVIALLAPYEPTHELREALLAKLELI